MSEAVFNNKIEKLLSEVWPDWKIDKKIGQGATGAVYKIVRKDQDIELCSAVKIITIPEDSSEVENLRYEGYTQEQTRSYLKEIVHSVIDEVKMMSSLRGAPNIVQIEDYKVLNVKNEDKWIIFIRMEMLTPLNEYICDKTFTEADVIKLGVDICKALALCEKKNIIHRDIKPENIFVNEFGDYKIGDFGISKQLENLAFAMSQKGSFGYVAPEVLIGGNYDATVDTYSLGVVMYKILNNNRLPFLDRNKQILSAAERQQATERRIKGETFPVLDNVSQALSIVINRACEFDPLKRFESAEKMQKALEDVAANKTVAGGNNSSEESLTAKIEKFDTNETNKKKVNGNFVITVAGVLLVIIICVIVVINKSYNSKPQLTEKDESVSDQKNENDEVLNVSNDLELNDVQKQEIYEKADDYMTQQMYKKAYEKLKLIESYKDVSQLLKECAYNAGIDCLIECDYDEAKKYLEDIILDEEYFNEISANKIYEINIDSEDVDDDIKEMYLKVDEKTLAKKTHCLEMVADTKTKIFWKWIDDDDDVDLIKIVIDSPGRDEKSSFVPIGEWELDSELNIIDSIYSEEHEREDWIYDLYSKERR